MSYFKTPLRFLFAATQQATNSTFPVCYIVMNIPKLLEY